LDFGNSLYGASADAMVQIVRLVKLIEAPAFGFLRLSLDPTRTVSPLFPRNIWGCPQELLSLKSLRRLVMLLPQTDAFHALIDRLKEPPQLHMLCQQRNRIWGPRLDDDRLLKIFAENWAVHIQAGKSAIAAHFPKPLTQESTFSFYK